MKRTTTIFVAVFLLLFASWWFFLRGRAGSSEGIIYRTAKVERGDVTLSFNASGVLQPLTVVDVKSKAGGEIVKLAVDEGSVVHAGDLIARIDPRDTKALYEQAQADLDSSEARRSQNKSALDMQIVQSSAGVTQAQSALAAAKLNLQTLEARAGAQPKLTAAAIAQAEANYNVAVKDLESFQRVSAPQTRAQVQGDLRQSQAAMETSKAAYQRNQTLLAKGYVSQAATDASRSAYEAAAAAYANAKVRSDKLEDDLRIQQQSAEARVDQSQAALATARANGIAVGSSVRDLLQAREQVRQAEAALAQAKSNRKQVDVQRAELRAATAAILRSKISRDNAKVQLDSTTVVAPRDGVVVVKYLEEGTIIPPGTSVFSEGTSIVQLADVSRMYVEVMADEADITNVRLGQSVRVRLEASPDHPILGKVSRINPGAITNDGVTQVKVRVEVNKTPGVKLMPGLNASCEFIEREVKHVLMVPSPAIQREGKKTFVEVMVQPNKTVRREVVTGPSGNSMVEILKGLSEGENVVTSKIDKRQIEDQQKKMEEASQERNPFSGGRQGGGARR